MIYTEEPDNFKPVFEVVSCFLEHQDKILLLHRQDDKLEGNKWGLCAGKIDEGENIYTGMTREIKEELGIILQSNNLNYLKKLYVRYPDFDFLFHMFRTTLDEKPEINLKIDENKNYTWDTAKNALNYDLVMGNLYCIGLYIKLSNPDNF